MDHVRKYIDSQLARGRAYFSKGKAQAATGQNARTVQSAIDRLTKTGRLVSPRRGFYLILRPEDRVFGVQEPARWIDPLMKHIGVDY